MIIKNSEYIARFSAQGAELLSFIEITSGKNYIWDANPDFWAKTSPILFPFVGALKDNTYLFEGKAYTLPRHGFARELTFSVVSHTQEQIIFVLDTAHPQYPFDYQLKVIYTLQEKGLTCTYEVHNPSKEKPLWYSIGAHPAFAIHTSEAISYADYYLEFNNDVCLEISTIADQGLISEDTYLMPLSQKRLPLSYPLFYKDALVMKNLKSNTISIKNTHHSECLKFSFENLPFFGIWAAKNADFVCLEPWAGIADATNHNQRLEEKEGILSLKPLETQKHYWQFSLDNK